MGQMKLTTIKYKENEHDPLMQKSHWLFPVGCSVLGIVVSSSKGITIFSSRCSQHTFLPPRLVNRSSYADFGRILLWQLQHIHIISSHRIYSRFCFLSKDDGSTRTQFSAINDGSSNKSSLDYKWPTRSSSQLLDVAQGEVDPSTHKVTASHCFY